MDKIPRVLPASHLRGKMCDPCGAYFNQNPDYIWSGNGKSKSPTHMHLGCVTNAQLVHYLRVRGIN